MQKLACRKTFGALAAAGALTLAATSFAADHSEAPTAAADAPADIGDMYAWHEGDKLYLVMTVAGYSMPTAGQTGAYDADVLYGFHIDNSGDNQSDVDIWVRFGQNGAGDWGLQVEGLPGAGGTVVGPVDTTVTDDSGLRVYAGLRDDPFFFDLQGFQESLITGALEFASLKGSGARDSLAGQNATAIVLEMDLAAARGSGSELGIWGTTARK